MVHAGISLREGGRGEMLASQGRHPRNQSNIFYPATRSTLSTSSTSRETFVAGLRWLAAPVALLAARAPAVSVLGRPHGPLVPEDRARTRRWVERRTCRAGGGLVLRYARPKGGWLGHPLDFLGRKELNPSIFVVGTFGIHMQGLETAEGNAAFSGSAVASMNRFLASGRGGSPLGPPKRSKKDISRENPNKHARRIVS